MALIIKLWKNFKVQPEIWFFYGFILTFTLTVRKVLWFFPLRGEFNEYSGIYVYLSDIFLVLTLIAWVIIILYNKIDILSMLKSVPPQKQGNCSTWNNFLLRGRRGTMIYILLPLVLVVWSFISFVWAENKIVFIFRSVKILEFYLLYVFILIRLFYWNVPRPPRLAEVACRREASGTLLKKIFGLVMIIGLIQAIIGIIQFLLQHSIGLFWLKESLISQDIAGVAKVIFNGETFIRTYGLFPHPNILGGFLMFSIFISWLYYKMFHSNRNVPLQKQENCSTWNNFLLRGKRGKLMFKIILGIQLLALILTFSKSAILGLFLGLSYYIYKNVPCGTFIDFLKKKKRLIIITSLIIIFSFVIAKPDLYSFLFKGLNERLVYVNVSRGTIWDNPILGIGNGQFVISMENLPVIKENWMLEPVHNVFLLVWSELGIVGLLFLTLFILYVFKNVPRGTFSELEKTFQTVFIGLLLILFFDHYLWDIQQGGFLLWTNLGFLVGAGECSDTI